MSIGLTVKLSGTVVLNFSIIIKYHPSFPFYVFIACHLSKIYLQSEIKRGFVWRKTFNFLFQKPSNFYSFLFLESIFFDKYSKKKLLILVKPLKNKHEHELFHRYFSVFFFLLSRNTYLRKSFEWLLPFILIERLHKNVKIPHTKVI